MRKLSINKKIFFLSSWVLIFFLAGCASTHNIVKQYKLIQYADGVNEEEAKVIAQKYFLDLPYSGPYNVYKPVIERDEFANQYPKYYFISFPSLNPKHNSYVYLVAVDMRTGAVIRSKEWSASQEPDFDWVFR